MEFTDNGIIIRTLEEITSENTISFSEITGDFDVAPTSAGGELIAIKSENDARFEQALANAYIQNTILATGEFLDKVGQRQGKYRRTNVPTVVIVTLSGTVGVTIPLGTTLKCSANHEIFATQYAVTIPAGGEIQVTAASVNYGVICPALSLSLDPIITGITASNTASGVVGYERESDASFRGRFESPATAKTNAKDGLQIALLNIAGVAKVRVVDNYTDAILYGEVPPRTFACAVLGGNQLEIADVIFTFMQNGNPSYGDITQLVKSQRGELYTVSFSRVVEVPITVAATLTIDPVYDSNAIKGEVQSNIIEYFDALKVGDTVVLDKVKSICWIDGVTGVSVLLNGSASSIVPSWYEIAVTNSTLTTVA